MGYAGLDSSAGAQWRAGRGARLRCTAALHCTALRLRSPARNMLP